MTDLDKSYEKVINYAFKNNFTSYDPYDGLNTPVTFLKATKLSRLFLVYFNKFSPINFRKYFGVKKSRQLMAVCSFANTLFERDEIDINTELFFDELYKDMRERTLEEKYNYHCWDAHHFPIQMRDKLTDVNIPGVVGNEIFGTFLINYYKLNNNEEVLDYVKSLANLILDKYYCNNNGNHFFRYKINGNCDNFTINASLKAASYLLKASDIIQIDNVDEVTTNVFRTAIDYQKKNGKWNYTVYFNDGHEKKQVDFHQGFILDDILLYMKKYGYKEPYLSSYQEGLEFFYRKQFLSDGRGLYRYPRKWPVNIHNQSQGIITFTRAADAGFGDEYYKFAKTIAEWTIENMQEKDGHFSYLKYPFFTNKISYIRWSDSAMANALAVLLNYEDGQNNIRK